MELPTDVADALTPLFSALPPDQAMRALVVTEKSVVDAHHAAVEQVLKAPAIAARQLLQAGLWLYIDDLDASHTISQGIDSQTGSFWHGIMHRREGDFGNSHYWFNRTGHHPVMAIIPGYNAHAFIDDVAQRHKESPEDLITLQQQEWQALFSWCAMNG